MNRNHTSNPREGSSRELVVAEGLVVSRSKCCGFGDVENGLETLAVLSSFSACRRLKIGVIKAMIWSGLA